MRYHPRYSIYSPHKPMRALPVVYTILAIGLVLYIVFMKYL